MHRYSAATGGSGVGNNTTSGVPRDTTRPDLPFPSTSTFSLTSRRPLPIPPYKLKCDREPLNARLGPPDFYPPTLNCAEESLSRDTCQSGYREVIDGIEEGREVSLTLVPSNSSSLASSHSLWTKPLINRYKESIRKRLRALNNALVRKRKAGQVYGVPLTGLLLTKPGQYPEQRQCGEDYRKKWIEDLAQHKRLRVLAEYVPHGLRRRSLFEALIKNEVPFLRATWCIKVMYLNQVRPLSIGTSAGCPDKLQLKRAEVWTRDAIEYIQSVLDELCQNVAVPFANLGRESSPLIPLGGASQHGGDFTQGNLDGEEPSLHEKWHYMLRLIQLHYSEGLLQRPQVIEWVLKQLQERESIEAVELLLPLVLDFIDGISMSQTYVRMLVDTSLHRLAELCPTGSFPDGNEQPRLLYVATFLTELLRYLILVVPDTFVALDCFPLPPYVCAKGESNNSPSEANLEEAQNFPDGNDGGKADAVPLSEPKSSNLVISEKPISHRELAIVHVTESVQKRAASLAKAVKPGILRSNAGKVIQNLDKAVCAGDVIAAYRCIFDEDLSSFEQLPDEWLAEVSPWFKLGSGFSAVSNPSEVLAVRFLCEWAICDFRDCRSLPLADRKVTITKDMSRVYMAVSVLHLRMEDMEKMKARKGGLAARGGFSLSGVGIQGTGNRKSKGKNGGGLANFSFAGSKGSLLSAFFQSPGPIHDIVVAWLDQHLLRKGEGFESLQLLLLELVHKGLFWPPAYVRQLIISGILEKKETDADLERAARHRRLLQHMPGPPGLDEGKSDLDPLVMEAFRLYRNERRLALAGYGLHRVKYPVKEEDSFSHSGQQLSKEGSSNIINAFPFSEPKPSLGLFNARDKANKSQKTKLKILQLKQVIATSLHFPEWCLGEQVKSQISKTIVSHGGSKRQFMQYGSISDRVDATPGCEECGRSKRQKTNEGKALFSQGSSIGLIDEEEMWWVKKMPKAVDTVKVEPPVSVKPPKQTSRGRPKIVRKVSLAQLAPARIEGSQGASSSHTCDSKVHCPYHKSSLEGAMSQNKDLKAIGSMMRRLRLGEKRLIASWLDDTVRSLTDEGEKVASAGTPVQNAASYGVSTVAPLAVDERSSVRWKLGEEQLALIIYLMDVAMDYQSIVRILLWLLPKAVISISSSGQNSRGISTFSWSKDTSTFEIGEAVILTGLRRYERVLTAMNLLPETLTAVMQRAATVMAAVPGGRAACLALLNYVRDLYKRYSGLSTLQSWEKNWKASSDQRLVAELEALKAGESEPNFGLLGVASSGVGDDRDDPVPPRLMGRLARIGSNMKDIVQKGINDVTHQMVSREKELLLAGNSKDLGLDKWDEGYQAAQRVVSGLLDCIKQITGGAPQSDSQLAAAAVSAVVSNVASAAAIVFDNFVASNTYTGSTSTSMGSPLKCARQVLQIHVYCIRLLKEAFGDRHHRVLEVAFASEVTSLVASALGHTSGRDPRPQFQLSPETPDPSSALAGELGAGSNTSLLGRSTTAAAAVGALAVGVILNGIIALDRMISVLKVREGLEALLLSKNSCSNSNGISRAATSGNAFKVDNLAEVYVFWFRVLIGDSRSVAGGLLADILGESNLLSLARTQHLMPLATILPPAYALFGAALWRQHLSYINVTNREDVLFQQAVCTAVGDLLAYEPFREVCFQDTRALYVHLVRDTNDSEYAALLDMQGLDKSSKVLAMVPLRARLFLHAVLDRKMPALLDDEAWVQGRADTKGRLRTEANQVEQLVQVLDDLQPATFHWQWVELRLLLNEQVLMEKLEGPTISAAEAVQAVTSGIDNGPLSESEKTFTEIVMTRLLVRPDAAALYSEAVHLLGKALEEYLVMQVKWFLENTDMLLGRKSLRQQLEKIVHRKGYKIGKARVKAWTWLPPQGGDTLTLNDHERTKPEVASPEEGEVAEGVDWRKESKQMKSANLGCFDEEGYFYKNFSTEKALADLILPCLARSSETCNGFAFDLVKQLSNLEQHVTLLTRPIGRPMASSIASVEGAVNKSLGSRRRGALESGSPGPSRRFTASVVDTTPASSAALQTSMWLRLQFLLPLLPLIHNDREPSPRNMRQTLGPVLLRLLGTRIVQEASEPLGLSQQDFLTCGRDIEYSAAVAAAAAAAAAAGEGLFDRLLSILHALLSSSWAVWLKPRQTSKGVVKPLREVPHFDRETAERMQVDLDHMQLPSAIRVRLQGTMPVLCQTSTYSISAGPQVPATAFPVFQNSGFGTSSLPTVGSVGLSQKAPFRLENTVGKGKPLSLQESEVEIDPWTLLEDGTGSGGIGGGSGALVSGESGNLKACSWLRGAVRVRRTDLTYVGAVDDDT